MINTVNADEDAGVTMKYSRLTDAFTITADAGGAESNVTVINISGNAFGLDGAFGIGSGSTILPGYGTKGQNALLTVEGIPVTRDSNEFTVDGIKYTLKNTTGEAVNFTVSRDVSSIVEKVKAFADAYNKLAEELNGLLSEKDYSGDYKPLTATQEGEMSDKQIETWNEKAKSGLLRNNRSLKSFVSGSKNAFYSALGGTGKTAASIGVASASYYSSDAGKIVVDEAALTKALEENPEKVIAMFTSSAADSKGLIYKMSDSATSYIKNLDASIKASGLTTSKLETRIGDMEDDLDTLTERYYQKFSAMEQALGRLNSQVSLMSSLFAS